MSDNLDKVKAGLTLLDLDDRISGIEERQKLILSRLAEILALMQPEEASTTRHEIDLVERYVSNSGNVTWKAFNQDDDIIYLRQAHKQLLIDTGLWDQLNAMSDGERCRAAIWIETEPDGDFHRPVGIDPGGVVYAAPPKPSIPPPQFNELATFKLAAHGDFVVLDTKTTDIDGYVCQVAVIDRDGNTLLHKLVRPPKAISPGATQIHGISNEMVANADMISGIADSLRETLSGKTVIGWNVNFDLEALLRSARWHDLKLLVEALMDSTWLDAMSPFNTIYGEWSEYHQSYTWQKLTTAAAYYGISGAHGALADAKMTLAVVKRMMKE